VKREIGPLARFLVLMAVQIPPDTRKQKLTGL